MDSLADSEPQLYLPDCFLPFVVMQCVMMNLGQWIHGLNRILSPRMQGSCPCQWPPTRCCMLMHLEQCMPCI